jgi:integrase
MVIIRERNIDGIKHFDLLESKSGRSMRWTPSKDFDDSAIDFSLAVVATKFSDQCEAGSPKGPIFNASICSSGNTGNLTLSEYIRKQFLYRKESEVSDVTKYNWDNCIKLRIGPQLGSMQMSDITPQVLTDFMAGLQHEGLAHGSIHQYYTLLNQIFKMAHKTDGLPSNPMAQVDRPKKNKNRQPKKVKAYSPTDMASIESAISQEPLKWQTFIHLVADTGIRRGEALGIKQSVIDYENSKIRICANLSYVPRKGTFLQTPKNGKERWVYISPHVLKLIRALELENKRAGFQSEFLFVSRNGVDPLTPGAVGAAFKRIGNLHGIEKFGTHRLRHTFASIAITNGADVASVAELLGHSDSTVTLRNYTKANEDSLKRASQIRRDAVTAAKTK